VAGEYLTVRNPPQGPSSARVPITTPAASRASDVRPVIVRWRAAMSHSTGAEYEVVSASSHLGGVWRINDVKLTLVGNTD